MNQVGNRIKIENYRTWIERPSTHQLFELEAGWLLDALHPLRGLHLAYAGVDQCPAFLKKSRCHHHFRLGLPWQRGEVDYDVAIHDHAWPLADETVDVVVLQHALDLSRRPHQLIREACRTLVPNGYLVVAGLNPFSWWGLIRLFHTFSSELPWVTNPVNIKRLQDWLTLLDFKVEYVQNILQLWPGRIASQRVSRRIDRVVANKAGLAGNGYILVARKTQTGVTPIRERRWLKSAAGFPIAAAATCDGPII